MLYKILSSEWPHASGKILHFILPNQRKDFLRNLDEIGVAYLKENSSSFDYLYFG